MEKLKINKRVLKSSLTKLREGVEGENFGQELAEIILNKNKVNELHKKFDDTFTKIFEACKDDEFDAFLAESHEVQATIDKFNLIILRAENKINEGNNKTASEQVTNSPKNCVGVKLPEFHIPQFSGSSITEWLSFSDLFLASVGQNPKISPAQKLQYLLGSLKGDALKVIQSLPITDANFDIAWGLLKERYSNRRELIFSLLKKIMSMQQLNHENAQSLLQLVDTSKEVIRALKSLEIKVEGFSDSMFVYVIVQKLDSNSRSWWERGLKDDSIPTLEELLSFLVHHSRTLQQPKGQAVHQNKKLPPKVSSYASRVQNQNKCMYCNGSHLVFGCPEFKGLTVQKRHNFIKTKQLCFNCFANHPVSACKSKFSCKVCSRRHNSLLHFDKGVKDVSPTNLSVEAVEFNPVNKSTPTSDTLTREVFSSVSSYASNTKGAKETLLCTAVIRVLDSANQYQHVRALLDPGSQASFLSEACFQRLGLSRKRARVQISCLGSSDAYTNGITSISFTPHYKTFPTFATSVFILNKIIGQLPQTSLDPAVGNRYADLTLADPNFFKTGPIDILLGVDIALPLLKGDIIKNGPENPFAVRSELGWIISGNVNMPSNCSNSLKVNSVRVDMDSLVSDFWKLDSVPNANPLTKAEQACEGHFQKTHSRGDDGRYCVRLPFSASPSQLGDSKEIAQRRFYSLEKVLSAKPDVRERYSDFIREYFDLGHMERVPESEENASPNFYFPHHAIFKESSSTTKLRVVFDASVKSSSGLSLNDILMTGPKVQDLFTTLLRFRTHSIAICADAEKMFRQIRVHPDDTNFQRILWRNSAAEPISIFRLTTVSYGTACASFLSTRVIKQLALDEKANFPAASKVCLRDFYVDDLLTGAGSLSDATQLCKEIFEMMQHGGFRLRKWISNCPSVLQCIPDDSKTIDQSMTFDNNETVKILGIVWDPTTDFFNFSISVSEHQVLTKRKILSEIARVFDPLGWLSPTVIFAKIFLQELWSYKLGWDDNIGHPMAAKWKNFHSQLPLLSNFKIPRYVFASSATDLQLHAFCDSSEKAYCAVIYLRAVAPDQLIHVSLLTSKTRVAPVRTLSLPRLELCSALLLATLLEVVLTAIEIPINKCYAWSDSKVTLAWIASEPRRWLPFVGNRVARIQEAVPNLQWNHVPGVENPADCGTRGLQPSEFLACNLWTCGPPFLKQPSESSFLQQSLVNFAFEESHLKEAKKTCVVTATVLHPDPAILKFSSFTKLCRVFAWCLRFVSNCSKPNTDRDKGPLRANEISKATLHIVKSVQQAEFSDDLRCLRAGKSVKSNSKILSLCPFLDSDGVMRVGGRLRNATISQDVKHPIIIPKNHHFTKLIINYFHLSHLHASPQLLLAVIRQKFWIPCGRDVVRRFVKNCVVCYRLSATSMSQLMGDLPAARVTPAKAFSTSGVDFAGPFLAKERNGRGRRSFKIYIAVFVCFCTRAMHLEVVSDLTTQAFIAALKRFISRRGKPCEIVSDCATNFVGANRELKATMKALLSQNNETNVFNFSASEGIKWSFNPPASPHFGGLWESGVKSLKYHLRRTMGNSLLSLEELFTLTAQIEACLNSRPLCPLSSDPNDLAPLTPGHFLIGSALTAVPEPDVSSISINRLSRWQLVQRLMQQFWSRWSKEFLARLQQRPKWCLAKANIAIGDLVLIKDELAPPLKWKLARVVDVHPGKDEKVRVVTLKTGTGQLVRPITKLCKLPLN